MSAIHTILHALGIKPWERIASLPIAQQITALFEREERDRGGRPGRALDIGCGSGIWSVALAKRGWDVTGVDLVPKALRVAGARARAAGVEARFVRGDVTALPDAVVDGGFDLFLDVGTVHGLDEAGQRAVGRAVTELAAQPATLILMAFTPAQRWVLPRGMGTSEIEAAYPGWGPAEPLDMDLTGVLPLIRRAKPRWYRLRRSPGQRPTEDIRERG